MERKEKVILVLILILSVFLRIFFLDRVPPALFGDEIDIGYQAYSLWTTGRDYMGNRLPFYLQSINEWRNALLVYLTAPFVGLVGLNEWGVRLPPALFGVISVYLVYFLSKELSKNSRIGLWSAFVCAIIPWHIHYSRSAFDQTLFLCLILSGILFFLKKKFIISAVFFGLTFYTYNTANIFIPILILFLLLTGKNIVCENYKKLIFPGLVLFLIGLPIFLSIFFGQGAARFNSISVFSEPKIVDKIVFKRNTGLENQLIERFFHNKLWSFGEVFAKNYLSAFSPWFLFLSGDANPRHNVPGFGQLFIFTLPFLFLGVFSLLKSPDERIKKIVFFWLLLAPVPSALTYDGGGHATRLFLMVFPLVFLIATGIEKTASVFWKKSVIILVFLFCLIFWEHEYLIHYPKEQAEYWRWGYKEALVWVKDNEERFSKIILNNNHDPMLVSYNFWTKKPANWFIDNYNGDKYKKDLLLGFDGFIAGNVFLGGIAGTEKQSWLKENLDKDTLYLAFQTDEVPGDWDWEKSPPGGIKVLKTVRDPSSGLPFIYLLTKDEN